MSETVIVALISTSGSVLVAITALLLNYYGFQLISRRIDSLERRLELLEAKVEVLAGRIADLDKRLTLLERGRGLVHSVGEN